MSTLFVIATPIGNLGDITYRAVEVLSSVDVIVCEDTRETAKLLARYQIQKPLVSMNARTERMRTNHILSLLREGKNIALVSDAGTPTISDPGSLLVSSVRAEIPEVSIVSVPGPSAVSAALSVSGFPSSEFLFLGFLPNKKGRETMFREIAESKRTVVFYESPHRIMKTLASLAEHLPSNRHIALSRELTKKFEEVISGSVADAIQYLTEHPEKQRGEFVGVVDGR